MLSLKEGEKIRLARIKMRHKNQGSGTKEKEAARGREGGLSLPLRTRGGRVGGSDGAGVVDEGEGDTGA